MKLCMQAMAEVLDHILMHVNLRCLWVTVLVILSGMQFTWAGPIPPPPPPPLPSGAHASIQEPACL